MLDLLIIKTIEHALRAISNPKKQNYTKLLYPDGQGFIFLNHPIDAHNDMLIFPIGTIYYFIPFDGYTHAGNRCVVNPENRVIYG
jgi:hypothetical protein